MNEERSFRNPMLWDSLVVLYFLFWIYLFILSLFRYKDWVRHLAGERPGRQAERKVLYMKLPQDGNREIRLYLAAPTDVSRNLPDWIFSVFLTHLLSCLEFDVDSTMVGYYFEAQQSSLRHSLTSTGTKPAAMSLVWKWWKEIFNYLSLVRE